MEKKNFPTAAALVIRIYSFDKVSQHIMPQLSEKKMFKKINANPLV